ncbi:amidophosphoribosyltransferase [Conoideocrella luteorostrata]|uniref:Amidophosphoribosyltransferase n=1 Tax=Conoideocrella luteorostrata TaxID=1105319 RepID=A0AAJ0CZ25_9HYPO|nr:amidophosphoribosyltransferase [Conoideocrella luteorostrata]
MATNMTYLITGANRGIGKQLVSDLLLRPSTTVVGTVRDPNHDTAISLKSLPLADKSQLVVVPLKESRTDFAYNTLHGRLLRENINTLDVVIANAGASPSFDATLETDPEVVRECMDVNSIGPLRLFQACWALLDKSDNGDLKRKKFVLISSSTGSISVLDYETFPNAAYGMSKAAANWLAKKLSVEFKDRGLKVGIIHPGWVRTGMGQQLANAVGVLEPPNTVEESSRQVLEQVDNLSFETTHGKFVSIGGQVLPW